ncbi:hypothetical protein [Streptomyces iconiensis]|uniref:Uncharacterized protein n=1 Tax=Streptomyces iconiensis TaxID=1384038 RepID=A0ABT6ZWW6_9ACTN|nr:hypothetical protein [Streptomyces iconiensis]MDJ1133565.1 hypothetical protein [Streptomyces iconiensis]
MAAPEVQKAPSSAADAPGDWGTAQDPRDTVSMGPFQVPRRGQFSGGFNWNM